MAINLFTGAISNNWPVAGNWSQGTIPTASDGHVTTFDATSPNCTLGANRLCNEIDFTGYTGTLTMGGSSITVSGAITFGAAGGMTISGTGGIVTNVGSNIYSGGFVWPNTLAFQGTNQTYTLLSDITVGSALSLNGTTTLTINNDGTPRTIYATANVSTSAAGCQGTAKIVLSGTGTVSMTAAIRNDMDINTAGTITTGVNFRYAGGTLTYVAGSVDTITNNTTFFPGLSGLVTTNLDVGAITWRNITNTSGTVNLLSDLNCAVNYVQSTAATVNGPGKIRIQSSTGTGAIWGGSQTTQGTGTVVFEGSNCTWTGSTGLLQLNVEIDTPGTLTINGTVLWRTATMTYISGTVAGTGTISVTSIASWDTDGCTLPNVNITTSVQTLLSTLRVGTLTMGLSSTVTFAGSFGFNVDHLVHVTTNRAVTFTSGNTYTVNESITATGSGAVSSAVNSVTLQTTVTSSPAYINFGPTCVCHCRYVRVIDIDSSGGREMYTVKGLVARSTNWIRTDPDPYQFF